MTGAISETVTGSARDIADRLVATLGEMLGIADAAFDAEARLGLTLENGAQADLVFVEAQGTIMATAELADTTDMLPSILQFFAETNLNWPALGGGIFSIPPGGATLCFSTCLQVTGSNDDIFAEDFMRFAVMAAHLRNRITDFGEEHDLFEALQFSELPPHITGVSNDD
jgi:hypothetical protein